MFNDAVGLDLLFLNTYEKTHLACHEHRLLGHAVNLATKSKIHDNGYSAFQHVCRQKPSTDGGCHFGMRKSRPIGRYQATSMRTDPGTVEDHETLLASLVLDHKRRWKRALHHAAKHYQSELLVGKPLRFWRHGANAAKNPTNAFWHPGVIISNTLGTVWIACRGSVVKCAPLRCDLFTRTMTRTTNTSRNT